MPQIQVEPAGTDFAQGAIGLGQGLLAGMQLKQAMQIDRERADMLRAQLMEERRARQVYEGQRQQGLDMDREELGLRREDRKRRLDSEMGLVETSLSSLERMLGDDPSTEDIRAEIGIAKSRLAPEHLQPYLEQIQAEIEMRHAPLAVEQMGESLQGMVTRGVIDEGQAQQYQDQMQRWMDSGGADGMDPDMVGQQLDRMRERTARQTSAQMFGERTAMVFEEQVGMLPPGSSMQADAQYLVEQIRLAQDPQEVQDLSNELRRLLTGEAKDERAWQRAAALTRAMDFDFPEDASAFFERVYEQEMGRGDRMMPQAQQEAPGSSRRGVPDVDKEKLRAALMEALGDGGGEPRKPGRKTKAEMDEGGGFIQSLGEAAKSATSALNKGVSDAADVASQGRRSRGSRKPPAEPKPKPTPKAPEGSEETRKELRRAEAKLKRLRQGHPDEKAIEATKKLIAELKARLEGEG